MNCISCGAPLPAKTLVCPFCNTRNSVDLRSLSVATARPPAEPRDCPQCRAPMESLNVGHRSRFFIEKCTRCHGLFFDLNELHALLDDAVAPAYEINYPLLTAVGAASPAPARAAAYVPCPDCGKLMNRVRFGERSGVVVDRCRDHGIWLEGGELRRLMEWKKAGGEVLERRQPAPAPDPRADELIKALTQQAERPNLLRSLDRLFSRLDGL